MFVAANFDLQIKSSQYSSSDSLPVEKYRESYCLYKH